MGFCMEVKFTLSPGGRLRMQLPRGPIEYSFHFIGVGNGTEGFTNTGGDRPFWDLENVFFFHERSLRKQLPRGPLDPSFHFIGVGNGTGGFKNTGDERPFWKLENVLTPGGSPIEYSFHFIGVGNETGAFQKRLVMTGLFWKFENVLSPEGSLRKQLPRGPLDRFLHFLL